MMKNAIPFDEAYLLAKEAPIIMRESEARMLYEYALQSEVVVEVGSAFGGSATILIAAGSEVHCIDPLLPSLDFVSRQYNRCGTNRQAKPLLECFTDQMERIKEAWNRSPKSIIKRIDVDVKSFPHDMLFIDHTHQFKDVDASIKHWRKATRKYMMFHDYDDPRFPGVKEAIDKHGILASRTICRMAVIEVEATA